MSKSLISRGFKQYDKNQLLKNIEALDIYQEGNTVVTKWFGVVKSVCKVSKLYEIFDVKNFMREKVDFIEKNFDIKLSYFRVFRGIQELVLVSDEVEIGGLSFHKSFFILNSSDKSRRLSLQLGLIQSSDGTCFINSIKNFNLVTKHIKGITHKAQTTAENFDIETFDEQIESIRKILGERVMFSQVKNIIVDEDLGVNHAKFNAFKSSFRYTFQSKLTREQISLLMIPSDKLTISKEQDFAMDAFDIFRIYMNVFKNEDSYIVRKETEKIFKITQHFIREEKIQKILDLI